MRSLIVYHSKDWDGVMSGAIARIKFPKAKMLGWNYGDTVPSLEEYDTIYMADITFPKEVMEQNYNKMVLIDHHAPTLKTLQLAEFKHCYCDMTNTYSAAYLTYKYCFPNNKMPRIVECISAYDIFNKSGEYVSWALAYDVQLALRELPLTIEEGVRILLSNPILELSRRGREIHHSKNKEEMKVFKHAWTVVGPDGKEGLAVFSPNDMSSLICEKHIELVDFILLIDNTNENKIKCSFRSKDNGSNVQEYAKRFGGGGHIHAAGCLITKKDLDRIINNKILF